MSWLAVLQGASFVGLLIVTTFAGLQRGQTQNLKATVAGLRGDRDDLTERLDRRDGELAEEKTQRQREREADGKQIAKLEEAVSVLRSTVTGETHLVTLEDLVTHMNEVLVTHHEAAMVKLDALEKAVNHIREKA